MSPESKCLQCSGRLFSSTWDGIKQSEREHHRTSARSISMKGVPTEHACGGFLRFNDRGVLCGCATYEHGQLIEEEMSLDAEEN